MMDNLHNWSAKGIFDRDQRVDGKVVSTTHPLANLSLFLAQKQSKILLLHAFFLIEHIGPDPGIAQRGSGFDAMLQLHDATGVPIPGNLSGLDQRPVLHRDVIDREQMLDYVLKKAVTPSWNE